MGVLQHLSSTVRLNRKNDFFLFLNTGIKAHVSPCVSCAAFEGFAGTGIGGHFIEFPSEPCDTVFPRLPGEGRAYSGCFCLPVHDPINLYALRGTDPVLKNSGLPARFHPGSFSRKT